jgi:hypothetical protein
MGQLRSHTLHAGPTPIDNNLSNRDRFAQLDHRDIRSLTCLEQHGAANFSLRCQNGEITGPRVVRTLMQRADGLIVVARCFVFAGWG